MSAYSPPVENVPIFDAGLFRTTNGEGEFLTIAEANRLYLQFPFGQGSETIPAVNITGNATISQNIVMNGTAGTNYLQFPDGTQQFTAVPSPFPVDNLQAVLDAGNTANLQSITLNNTPAQSQTFISGISNSYLLSFENFSPAVPFTTASLTSSVEKQQFRQQSFIANGASNIYSDAKLELNGDPVGDPNNVKSQVYLQDQNDPLAKNITTTYRTDGITQVNTGATASDYTITTDNNLLINSSNITASSSSILFGSVASSVFSTHTATGFNAVDNNNSAFAFYRNNQLSIYGTGNASLLANKTSLTYTDSAGTGTGALTSSALTMVSPTTGTSLYNAGSARISSVNSAGASAPILTLENSTAGANAGVAIETNKNGGAGVIGDEVFRLSMKGKNSGNTTAEYGRITCNIRDPTTSGAGIDGGLTLSAPINNTMTTFLDLNGNNGNVNCLRNLDMRTNDILSTTANLRLICPSTSSGAGSITIEPKGGGTGFLILNNLPTSSAGLPVGAVWRNGSVLNIV